jgi:DNA-binding transcriptional ArsR family regulator
LAAFPATDRTLIRSMRLGFLGPWPFRCENPADESWISLDFLGFSRPDRDFSMDYEALSEETFFSALFGGMNASDLRRGMAISQPAMSQHLAVLRSAGLVRERRDGRFVNYEVDPEGLVRIGQWLARYRAYWPRRIDDLKTLLRDMDQ